MKVSGCVSEQDIIFGEVEVKFTQSIEFKHKMGVEPSEVCSIGILPQEKTLLSL